MSDRRFTQHVTAVLAALLIGLVALPAAAGARPPDDAVPVSNAPAVENSTPAPTVVRTVVREEAVSALPIVLGGAALLIAVGGTGLALARVAPLRREFQGGHGGL